MLNLFAVLDPGGRSIQDLTKEFEHEDTLTFKNALTEILIETICPIGEEIKKLQSDVAYIDQVLEEGGQRARHIADANIAQIKNHMGLSL